MTKTVLYNPDLLDNLSDEERTPYIEAIQKFMVSNTAGLNLEKLKGTGPHAYYTIRASQDKRLVLMPKTREGKQYWLLVDILPTHNYQDIRWLHGYRLEEITEVMQPGEPLGQLREAGEAVIEANAAVWRMDTSVIWLDALQQRALDSKLPSVIHGAPGSGKTSTLLARLKKLAKHYMELPLAADGEKPKLLYVTKSEELVQFMMREWATIVTHNPELPNKVSIEFKTERDLLNPIEDDGKEETTDKPKLQKSEELVFSEWFSSKAESLTKQDKAAKATPAPNSGAKSKKSKKKSASLLDWTEYPQRVREEFRVMSGYDTYEEYLQAVGQANDSLFQDDTVRKMLWGAYLEYRAYLQDTGHIDQSFHPLKPLHYNLVLVDEVQDFSRYRIKTLCELAINHQIVFSAGDHQQLYESYSIVNFIRSFYRKLSQLPGQQKTEVAVERLIASYRCPPNIIDFVNEFLILKTHIIGGTYQLNQGELREVAAQEDIPPGQLKWLEENALEAFTEKAKQDVDFAVITPEEHLAEAIAKFGEARVFLVKEIKGMQYKHILLYRMFDEPRYEMINKLFPRQVAQSAMEKSTDGCILNSVPCNEFFVGATRAERSLTIYQPLSQKITNIRQELKTLVDKVNGNAQARIDFTVSSAADREHRAELLRQYGHADKADVLLASEQRFFPAAQPELAEFKANPTPKPQAGKEKSKPTPIVALQPKSREAIEDERFILQLIDRIKMALQSSGRNEVGNHALYKSLVDHPRFEKLLFDYDVIPMKSGKISLFLWMTSRITIREVGFSYGVFGAILKQIKDANSLSAKFCQVLCRTRKLYKFKDDLDMNQTTDLPLSLFASIFSMVLSSFPPKQQRKLFQAIKQHVTGETFELCFYGVNEHNNNFVDCHFSFEQLPILRDQLGIDINRYNGMLSLIELNQLNNIERYHQLGVLYNRCDPEGETLINYVVSMGDQDKLEKLYNVNAREGNVKTGETPFHKAASAKYKKEIFDILLKCSGCPIAEPDNEGDTPIHVAAHNGNTAALAFFQKYCFDQFEKANKHGQTPVDYAIAGGQENVLKIFFIWRLNVSIFDNDGYLKLAFLYAITKRHENIIKLLVLKGLCRDAFYKISTSSLHALISDLADQHNDGWEQHKRAELAQYETPSDGREGALSIVLIKPSDFARLLDIGEIGEFFIPPSEPTNTFLTSNPQPSPEARDSSQNQP